MDWEWRCTCWFTVQFSFGWNTLRGVGHASDCDHHNVLHLAVQRDSAFDRAIISLLRLLPANIRAPIRRIWPGYFLPDHVVLKKRKPGWEEDFENEKAKYARLQPLQGHTIPIYYGEAQCDGTPAILLEDVEGEPPFRQQRPFLSEAEFRRRLEAAYETFRSFGLMTDDTKLGHTLLVGDKVVFVDLEGVHELDKEAWEDFYRIGIDELVYQYQGFLKSSADE